MKCFETNDEKLYKVKSVFFQNVPVGGMQKEPKSSVDSMLSVLRELRETGSPSVCSRASSCMVALAIASGHAEHLSSTVQCLICVQRVPTTVSFCVMKILIENFRAANRAMIQYRYRKTFIKYY